MSDGEINVDSIDGEVLTTANIVGELYPQGEKGDKGDPGNDGFSPTVTTEKVGKTTTITITDAEGEHTATILDGADGQCSGDMLTSVYDTDHNGIVDNAEKVNGKTVLKDVPADAVFTDTTYTAGTGIDITGNVITNTQTSAEWGNITGTLSDQTDLKSALDDKADTSSLSSVATSGDYDDLSNKPTIPQISDTYGTSTANGYTQNYLNEHNVVVSATEPTNKNKVWLQHKDNLFDKSEAVITNGYFDGTSGTLITGGGSYVTENYTEVEANKTYKVGNVSLARVVFYNSSKAVISISTTNTSFTTPANTKYIRIQISQNSSNIIIQEGSSIVLDKTYILGTNNEYDEFLSQNEIYSTTETKVGTWIDGKPIYRRVLDELTTNSTAFTEQIYNISSGIRDLIRFDGFIKPDNYGTKVSLNYYYNSSTYGCTYFDNIDNNLRLRILSNYTSKPFVVVLEYTKTTD